MRGSSGAQTTLTHVGHLVMGGRARVTGVFYKVDQRGIIVFFRDGAFLHAVAQQTVLSDGTKRQSHGQPDPLAHDGALQKDGFPLCSLLAGQYFIWQLFHPGVVLVIGHLRHLGKNTLAGIRNAACNISHGIILS